MIAAIVLAAGRSSRFDPARLRHKLLVRVDGEALVRRSVRGAVVAPVDEVNVVVRPGADGAAIAAALDGLAVSIVVNADEPGGLAASIRAGIAAVAARAEAVVIALGDQPYVPAAAYEAVIAAWRDSAAPIAVPSYRGTRGHPVLFARAVYEELIELAGDVGAREVIARSPERVRVVELELPPPRDVDTLADLDELRAAARSAPPGPDAGRR
jgi:molybdenum cofactor cytidylyltransferase